ncbi:HD domain-containing protein [Chondrinema litorale]|uniref:HD domain-containing protein n=1 Tax=Chondrinema litorale TaxID=2994555 RepID=UPI0025433FDF|nr:HD domain-containing protein [Chondrinema litorale]UZR94978.1 HD domain-containing protein [Chondrinema litorale]
MWNQDLYQQTILFVAEAHKEQKVPGTDLPYLVHLSNVCMEIMAALHYDSNGVNPDVCMLCALLHDSVEDTDVTAQMVKDKYGDAVATGVAVLTKNESLPKPERMPDSLARIKAAGKAAGMVKMADRIVNLQAPPAYWPDRKIKVYQEEARLIHSELNQFHQSLAERLAKKIEDYGVYVK